MINGSNTSFLLEGVMTNVSGEEPSCLISLTNSFFLIKPKNALMSYFKKEHLKNQ